MNKSISVFCILMLISSLSFSQTPESKSLKSLNLAFSFPSFFQEKAYITSIGIEQYLISPSKWSPLGFGFGLQKPNGNIHNFGIWGLDFDLNSEISRSNATEIIYGFETNSLQSNFQYEYRFLINKKATDFERFIGIGIYPFLGYYKLIPLISTTYPMSVFDLSSDFALLLAGRYHFSEKFAMDISMPINVVNVSYRYTYIENPSWSVHQQRTGTINIESFVFSLRPCFTFVMKI